MTFDEGVTCEMPGYVCMLTEASVRTRFIVSTLSRPFKVHQVARLARVS